MQTKPQRPSRCAFGNEVHPAFPWVLVPLRGREWLKFLLGHRYTELGHPVRTKFCRPECQKVLDCLGHASDRQDTQDNPQILISAFILLQEFARL
jgi:hypothetical protein